MELEDAEGICEVNIISTKPNDRTGRTAHVAVMTPTSWLVRERINEGTLSSFDYKEANITEREYAQFVDFITSGADTREVACGPSAKVDAETQCSGVGDDIKVETVHVDERELTQFLLRVAPDIVKQLDRNLESHAFDEYEVSWDDERDTISKLHVLRHSNDTTTSAPATPAVVPAKAETKRPAKAAAGSSTSAKKEEKKGQLGGNDVAFNCNGTMVAVAYGRQDHEGWCTHRASLCLWNIMRRQLKPNQADIEIEVPCCLMCIEFHPKLPSVIVGGLFSGEIRLWDINNLDDPLIYKTGIDDCLHREPINSISWLRDVRDNTYYIVSIAGDGKILFWTEENKLQYPKSGACIVPTKTYHGHGRQQNRAPVIGGTALSFSPLDLSSYVVGTEAGGVLRCLAPPRSSNRRDYINTKEFKWHPEAFRLVEACDAANRLEVKRDIERYAKRLGVPAIEFSTIFDSRPDPRKLFPLASNFAYEPHTGPVYGVACSPFHRNIFVTCSTDGTIRIHSMLRPKPLLSLEPSSSYLLCIEWSTARPLVFAVGDAEGRVHIFDLKESTVAPVLVVPTNTEHVAVNALKFSSSDGGMMSSVDSLGRATVWQLSARLSHEQDGERTMIDFMGNAT